MFFVPDSPRHLVNKGKDDAARKALKWLRGSEYSGVEEELTILQNAKRDQEQLDHQVSFGELLTNGIYLKPLGIVLALMFFQQCSGINAVLFYLQDIFTKAGIDMDPGLSAFIVTLAQVYFALHLNLNVYYVHLENIA